MKVAVLGGGVVGVASAYYLAKAGHEVVLIDRQAGPAMETSFANAGEVSPGYASPWAAPGVPGKAVKWLLMQHAPLVVRPKADVEMYRFMAGMLLNCNEARYAVNKERMVRLATYSRARLEALRDELSLDYDQRMQGTLQLFRTQAQLDGIGKDVEVLQKIGVAYEVMDREGCIRAEPGLARSAEPFVGGLRLPGDETGDCFKFTTALADHARMLGVDFRFGEEIGGISTDGRQVTGVHTTAGKVVADAYVVAAGSWSPKLVRRLGIRLPVYPVKGYSITLPIIDEAQAPVSTLLDETYKVAITRLGDRIRVGGLAEVAGYGLELHQSRKRTLEKSVLSLFPEAGDAERATFWTGLRPATPDGTPAVGATALPNLFLNTGHGTLGWTMACGSGQLIADLISGQTPAIRADDLNISRYAA
ncbi:MAG: D-amino acid dehydrogenase [Caulobacter sp.]|nr:D-amino acid dehydrogenase [Caulobacter sp.]